VSAIDLMIEIIREHSPKNIWLNSPLADYRRLGNTNRGEIGEEFIRRFLDKNGFKTGNGNRTSPTDLRLEKFRFEIKTASLGADGTFQFNHIRMDRNYDYLLCLGICPEAIVYNIWRKGVVAENRAGKLVRMAEGQSVTYKLTKKLKDMEPIDSLPEFLRSNLKL